MGKITSHRVGFFIFFITGLSFGVILGATGLTALISYRIDAYHEALIQMASDLEDKTTRLDKLEQSLNEAQEERKDVLKDILIILDSSEEDTIDQITLTKHIKDKYTPFLGRDIETIDLEVLDAIVHERIFKLKDKEYQLMVQKIYLTDVLKLWVKVIPLTTESP